MPEISFPQLSGLGQKVGLILYVFSSPRCAAKAVWRAMSISWIFYVYNCNNAFLYVNSFELIDHRSRVF